jgi:uncharacterized protein YxjI
MAAPASERIPVSVDLNSHDVFVLRQLIRPMVNQYEFSLPGQEAAEPVLFVEQARFKFKEDIRFFADRAQTELVMRLKARQVFDPRARYEITDASGQPIGEIQKVFGTSLWRSTYRLFDAHGGETAIVTEQSAVIAVFRRVASFVPYVGDFLPIPYHFDFLRDGKRLGTNSRKSMSLRDVYTIDLTADVPRTLDRRLVLAAAVGMDALQAR